MKATARLGLFWTLLAMLALAFPAYAITEGDYIYTVSGGTATITDFSATYSGVLSISNNLGGFPVTCIGSGAFGFCTGLTSVTIPGSVTNIGSSAFAYCHNLASVTIPSSVTMIAFIAFANCNHLTAVTVESGNPKYSSSDGVLFNKERTLLVQYPGGKSGEYAIPEGVTNIEKSAFTGCSKLTDVSIPSTLISIGESAFQSCTSLNNVTIPSGVSIGPWAFYGCSGLTNVTIPSSVTTIADWTFRGCGLTSVTIPNNLTNIGTRAFAECTNLTSVTIPASVTKIGDLAFSDCTSLTTITVDSSNSVYSSVVGVLFNKTQTTLIQSPAGKLDECLVPSSVTSIGTYAFSECYSLAAITVGEDSAFYSSLDGVLFDKNQTILIQCPGRKSSDYTIPHGVISVRSSAFYYCTNLTSVVIPSSITHFESLAFAHCSSLTTITVATGNLVYSSVDGVLFNRDQTTLIQCPGGKVGEYTIPFNVTNIGDSAFNDCTRLTSVTIPLSVIYIGALAFCGCTNLTSVTIPTSVTNIGTCAFAHCPELTSVLFKGSKPTTGQYDWVFYGGSMPSSYYPNHNLTTYYLPGTAGWGATFGGFPTALWNPQVLPSDGNFGVRANCFGFTFTNGGSPTIVTEACTNLSSPIWSPVGTNTLTGGSAYFSDPGWTNLPCRFYRFRSS